MSLRYRIQHLAVDLLMWLVFPRRCYRHYVTLRRYPLPRLRSFHTASVFPGLIQAEDILSDLFCAEMAAAWGADDSWLTKYKGD